MFVGPAPAGLETKNSFERCDNNRFFFRPETSFFSVPGQWTFRTLLFLSYGFESHSGPVECLAIKSCLLLFWNDHHDCLPFVLNVEWGTGCWLMWYQNRSSAGKVIVRDSNPQPRLSNQNRRRFRFRRIGNHLRHDIDEIFFFLATDPSWIKKSIRIMMKNGRRFGSTPASTAVIIFFCSCSFSQHN